jgi:hypothetical protein
MASGNEKSLINRRCTQMDTDKIQMKAYRRKLIRFYLRSSAVKNVVDRSFFDNNNGTKGDCYG